jgi:sec-independent protein translocase protein TatC
MSMAHAPLIEHLKELRRRLILSLLVILVAFGVCFYFSEEIFQFLVIPLKKAQGAGVKVSYFSPTEHFFSYVSLSVYAAIGISFPMIASQLWAFIAPGLYKHERHAFLPFLLATPVMFIAGASLAYYGMMPAALGFLAHFHESTGGDSVNVVAENRLSDYISFAMTFILSFGICFQMPVLLVLLGRIGVISSQTLRKGRRYAILAIATLAAITTPPDLLSMVGLIVPLVFLYEVSIWFVIAFEKKRQEGELVTLTRQSYD